MKGVGAVRSKVGVLLTVPAVLLLFGTVIYPILWSLNLSLHSFDIINPDKASEFVGLNNYLEMLSSEDFHGALLFTGGFVIATLTLELVIAFPIALLLHRGLPGTGLFRLIFSLPLMVAPVVAGLLWQFMFADQYGAVNNILASLGIEGPLWLASVWGSRAAVLIGNLWLATPFVILVLLAGMATLPDELFEAARIDGARGDQLFWYVMLPLLRPALLIILVVRLTDAIRVFDIVYIITGGGPGTATEVLSTYIYRETFTRLHFAQAAAASFIMLAITALISLGTIRVLRSRE
jgi:multiple sugar transport system permease protein